MPGKPEHYYNQSAVIPFFTDNGERKIILITTRKKQKWTIPKGIVEPGMTPVESARQEAEEEAGIEGFIEPVVFDTFEYEKWGGICFVKVYLMHVNEIFAEWPEIHFRQRRFFSPEEAVRYIGREEIKPVLQKFSKEIE